MEIKFDSNNNLPIDKTIEILNNDNSRWGCFSSKLTNIIHKFI